MQIVDAEGHILSSGAPMAPYRQVMHDGQDKVVSRGSERWRRCPVEPETEWVPSLTRNSCRGGAGTRRQSRCCGVCRAKQTQFPAMSNGWKFQPGPWTLVTP
jgi:hypothetical protein